ncbi:hypothetical protein [Microbacterium protaetiae]|nr:hypothetical protein [Microbacterium protaetiae]
MTTTIDFTSTDDFFTLRFGSHGFEYTASRADLVAGPVIDVGQDYWH